MKRIMKVMNKVTAAVTIAEGLCASIVVDEALKNVEMKNKVVKTVGRSFVSGLISSVAIKAAMEQLKCGKFADEFMTSDTNKETHKVKIKYPNGAVEEFRAAVGDYVEIDASRHLRSGEDFMYWIVEKGDDKVELDNYHSAETGFIMPDCKVKITFSSFIDADSLVVPKQEEEAPEQKKTEEKNDHLKSPDPAPEKTDDEEAE